MTFSMLRITFSVTFRKGTHVYVCLYVELVSHVSVCEQLCNFGLNCFKNSGNWNKS